MKISDTGGPSVDWVRFEHLARYIRALSYPSEAIIDDDTIHLLCSRHLHRPILPNLRVLSWTAAGQGPGDRDIALLESLSSSPALCRVCVDDDRKEALDVLLVNCPDIMHLRYAGRLTELASTRSVVGFKGLRTVKFSHIEDELFRQLGSLPNLRVLEGALALSETLDLPDSSFPVLEELWINNRFDDTSSLTSLSLISSKTLAILSIEIPLPFTDALLEFLDKLCTKSALKALRKLDFTAEIEFDPFDNEDDEVFEGVVFGDVLRRLTRLPTLEDVSFVVQFTTSAIAAFDVDDADMDRIASAWPNLRRLTVMRICRNNDWEGEACGVSRPSLSAIISLATRCRQLEMLYIEFESVKMDELERLEARALECINPQRALREIMLEPFSNYHNTLRLTDPVRLAAALRAIFPDLTGGLGEPLEDEAGELLRHGPWKPTEFDTDAFRLLKTLEETHLSASWR